MDLPGTLLKAGDTDVALDVMQGWAAPNGSGGDTRLAKAGLIRIGDEFMYYTSTEDLAQLLPDVGTTRLLKSLRKWKTELHPNNNNENKQCLQLSGLNAGFRHQAHGPSARSTVTLFFGFPCSVLQVTWQPGRRLQCDHGAGLPRRLRRGSTTKLSRTPTYGQ